MGTATMGDTLNSMATSISTKDSNFELWDKGQLVVLISRTKHAKDSIFVGPKQDTLDAFKQLILQRNQWTDYIEDVLRLVTNNECDDTTTDQILTNKAEVLDNDGCTDIKLVPKRKNPSD